MNRTLTAALLLGLVALTALATGLGRAAEAQAQILQPMVLSVSPNYGAASGHTKVTIFGIGFSTIRGETGFAGMTEVRCSSANDCTATTQEQQLLPGTVHTAPVTATVNGVSGAVAASFTWYGIPTLTEITPTSGSAEGGEVVRLTGGAYPNGSAQFPGPTPTIRFGNALATGVDCSEPNGTVCSVRSPAGTGKVPVTITTPGGTSTSRPYTYIPPPTVTRVEPNFGPATGGTRVTITGTNFTADQQFHTDDGVPFTDVSCSSATHCMATTPAVRVRDGEVRQVHAVPAGQTAEPQGPAFFAYGKPVLTSLDPNSGPSEGDNIVFFSGGVFPGSTRFPGPIPDVHFGNTPGKQVNCSDPSGRYCGVHVPAGSGPVPVTVTTVGGTSTSLTYTYEAPVVTTISPAFGAAGGTSVTITGEHFTPDQSFKTDGGQAFTEVHCTSSTSCTARTPVLSVAPGDVTTFRTVVVGQTGGAQSNTFTAYGRPVIDGLSPNGGPILGGNTVTIAGATFPNGGSFPGPVSVRFGSTEITAVTCSTTNSTCSVTAPQGTGTVPVTITTPGGTSDPVSYIYAPPSTIIKISPNTGPTSGGTVVTIAGINFRTETGATQITFGSAQATDVVCSSTTQCTATTPPHSAGAVPVVMTTPDGRSNPVTFTYTGGAPAAPRPATPTTRCTSWSWPFGLIVPWQNCTG